MSLLLNKKIILPILFISLYSFAFKAEAATLFLKSSETQISTGNIFTVQVLVDTELKYINNAESVIQFPADLLEIVSVDKKSSIFSLWVEEPNFSNIIGQVKFNGGIPNPGFRGNVGNIISVVFRAKKAGLASIIFSESAVRENDGLGTDILNGLKTVDVNIKDKTPITEPIVSYKDIPLITSTTHPDQNKWYSNKNPELSWELPEGATEVRTLLGTLPNSEPTVSYVPPIKSKKLDSLEDGTYYFHLQIKTAAGWSGVAHYRINIDSTPPEHFSISFPHGSSGLEPQPVILFNTNDNLSGVDHYNVKIGNGGPYKVGPVAKSNPYPLPAQKPGDYTVIVSAIDRAGNSTSASAEFTIEAIETPVISYYTEKMTVGDIFKVRGTTYPNADLKMTIKQKDEVISEEITRSNSLGDFSIIASKRLNPGVYSFSLYVTDNRGAQSKDTKPLNIEFGSQFLNELIDMVLNYLSATILIILAIGGLVSISVFVWRHSLKLVCRLKKETKEAEETVDKSFKILRQDINTHISKVKKSRTKGRLAVEEVDFLERFASDLEQAEKIIGKEVGDISLVKKSKKSDE